MIFDIFLIRFGLHQTNYSTANRLFGFLVVQLELNEEKGKPAHNFTGIMLSCSLSRPLD